MRDRLACHPIAVEVGFQDAFECHVEFPAPLGIVCLLAQKQQVVAQLDQGLLHVLHALPHYILELNMPQGGGEPVDGILIVLIHLCDHVEQQLSIVCELVLHLRQIGNQVIHLPG